MAKVDLKKSTGFSIQLDGEDLNILDLKAHQKGSVSIDDIRAQLLNQELASPEVFYTKYVKLDNDEILESKGIRYNLTLIPPNLAGIEYVKTRAMKLTSHAKILEIAHGGGTVIMQSMNSRTPDICLVKVKRDQKIIIPAGYAMVFVNTRNSSAVISEVYSAEARNSSILDEMQGMAYYVIRKNAKQEIVQNPNYRTTPKRRKIKWDTILAKHNITHKTPIIKQILRKYDKFKWLFTEDHPVF